MNWLGDGWLGKVLLGVLSLLSGAVLAWVAKRPLEKAGILEAVNIRLESYMGHLEGEVKRLGEAHMACEARLEQMHGEVNGLKQTLASIEAVRGKP